MECIICYEPFPGESQGLLSPVAAMPCGHIFHSSCAIRCLNVSRKCPTCRRQPIRSDNLIYLYGDWENTAKKSATISDNQQKEELTMDCATKLELMKQHINEWLADAAVQKEAQEKELKTMRTELRDQTNKIDRISFDLNEKRQENLSLTARLNETSIKLKQKTDEAQEYIMLQLYKKY
ncbi:hypothetical protein BDF19DRAFT_302415 [Syncephalis fuscata]|nr:hypothetical protein BDF19DRAFT_302415 [Syncephalis fuscata]